MWISPFYFRYPRFTLPTRYPPVKLAARGAERKGGEHGVQDNTKPPPQPWAQRRARSCRHYRRDAHFHLQFIGKA